MEKEDHSDADHYDSFTSHTDVEIQKLLADTLPTIFYGGLGFVQDLVEQSIDAGQQPVKAVRDTTRDEGT